MKLKTVLPLLEAFASDGFSQLFHGGVSGVEDSHPPAEEDQDPVAPVEQLIQVRGHKDDGRARTGPIQQKPPDRLGGLDVEAPCWVLQ